MIPVLNICSYYCEKGYKTICNASHFNKSFGFYIMYLIKKAPYKSINLHEMMTQASNG